MSTSKTNTSSSKGLNTHIQYNSLLFVFPAAIVVSNASAIFANGIKPFEISIILALMYFVWIEYETSILWLLLEPKSPNDDVSRSQVKLYVLLLIDFFRIFSLSILYLAIIYGSTNTENLVVGRVQTDFEFLITLCSGLFLILNGFWNVIVKPDHKDVEKAIYEAFNRTIVQANVASNGSAEAQMGKNIVLWILFNFFKLFFYYILPFLGMMALLYFFGSAYGYCNLVPDISFYVVIMLWVQSFFKTVQFLVLTWTLHNCVREGEVRADK